MNEVSSTTCNILNDLESMAIEGYTAIALENRMSFIEFNRLAIPETQNEIMLHIFKTFWTTFASEISRYYTILGICPFCIVDRKITFQNKTYQIKVPVALRLGSFSISSSIDLQLNVSYIIHHKGMLINESVKTHVLSSSFRTGPSPYNASVVDSEFGILHQKWKLIQSRMKSEAEWFQKHMKHTVYIEHVTTASSRQHDVQITRYDEHLTSKINPYGYKEPVKPTIFHDEKNEVSIIPDDYIMSTRQPTVNLSMLDFERNDIEFKQLVDLALKIPLQRWSKTNIHGGNVNSEAALIEDRLKISAALSHAIVDITQALETVFLMIYPDEPIPMAIDLPHRTLMDLQTIEFLHTRGVLSSQNAMVEYANVVGLVEEKSQNHEKLKKKQKVDEEKMIDKS
jgi:hypothetical protein